jgi:hypothetical protein
MWFKKASPRRQAIREDLAELGIAANTGRGARRQFLLVALFFGLLAACLQFWPRNPIPYRVGEFAPMDLRAPTTFHFVDPVEADRVRALARETSPPVLLIDQRTLDQVRVQLVALRQEAQGVTSLGQISADIRTRFPSLDAKSLAALQAWDQPTFATAAQTFTELGLALIPIVSAADHTALLAKHATEVRLADSSSVERWMPAAAMDRVFVATENGVDKEARPEIRRLVGQRGEFSQPLAELVTDCVMALTRSTFHYDTKLSAASAEHWAILNMPVGPTILAGDSLVERGKEITAAKYQALLQSEEALEQEIAGQNPWAPWLSRLGLILTTLLLTGAGAFYIARMAPADMTLRRAWALAGLLWITLAAAKVIVVYAPITLLAIAPTLLVAIILVIAENQRFALGLAALHGLLAELTLRQGVDFYVPLLAGTVIFCFGLREIRTRGKLIEVGAVAGAGIFTAVWAIGSSRLLGLGWSRWIGSTDIHVTWADSLWGAGAGVAVAMFALAILPSIERLFKMTTAMTLLELCDANKPLLRRLSQEAPGTFNHSLTVGIMAEAAGNAIGANGLLCRVGAYYHDVGKLSKPQYFIENQIPGHPNRHDKLSPAMSLLIIVGHVKDGIELAREYNLPWVIHKFIAQHHGTTLVEYFFHAARKRAEKDDAPAVSDTEFRYPGPKPQTREAAIVMICDSCESLVRSIEEPTQGRIESAVHNMIMKRLLDGQFSECDLTLRELSVIEETLVRTLAGVHHGRVSYPSRPEDRVSDIGLSQPA